MSISTSTFSPRTILLFVLLVVTGFGATLYFRTTLVAGDDARLSNPILIRDAALAIERNKPRFSGDIGGIFLAPHGVPVPEKYTSFEDVCGLEPSSITIPDDQAGQLTLDLELPTEYAIQKDDMDYGVVACGNGVPYIAKKTYTYDDSIKGHSQALIIIGRTVLNYDEIDTASDRPKVMKIAGRDVVVIEPLTEDGFLENGIAMIPESFGLTFVHTSSLPREEFMKLVELVASSTRTQ